MATMKTADLSIEEIIKLQPSLKQSLRLDIMEPGKIYK